ncbi:hypothetical protein APHAL10511_007632 [Amanita phalloides]|nr:hypothetical protein APHAL10511_007632 [Amanita phalloides]
MASQQPTPTGLVRSPPVLPTEVVYLIMDLFATPLSTHELQSFPWFLGHICSTWRSIFLSMTAEFWCSISIWFRPERRDSERTKNVVQFFLERDPAAPFSFEVKSPHHIHEFQQHEIVHICQTLDILTDASMRWKGASFTVRGPTDLLPLRRAKHRLPLLQKILLCLGLHKVPDQMLDVFQNAPHLNDVVVRELEDWKFNLEDLKAISIDRLGSGAPHFITALPRMAKLKRLRIGTEFDDKLLSSIIVLPNLTTLGCEHSSLRFLEAPALEDLTIEYNTCNPFNLDVDNIRSFLSRSSSTMNILSLGIAQAGAATAVEIIKLTPQVARLRLMDLIQVKKTLKQLTISTNAPQEPLARHMLSLSITDFSRIRDYSSQLISLVSSRTRSSIAGNDDYKRLRKLDVNHVTRNAEKVLVALCKRRGVQFVGPK